MENSKRICLFWSSLITVIEKLSKNILLRKQPCWIFLIMHRLKGYLMWSQTLSSLLMRHSQCKYVNITTLFLMHCCQGSVDLVLQRMLLHHVKRSIKNKTKPLWKRQRFVIALHAYVRPTPHLLCEPFNLPKSWYRSFKCGSDNDERGT